MAWHLQIWKRLRLYQGPVSKTEKSDVVAEVPEVNGHLPQDVLPDDTSKRLTAGGDDIPALSPANAMGASVSAGQQNGGQIPDPSSDNLDIAGTDKEKAVAVKEEEEDSFEDDDEEEDDTTGDESDIEDNVEVPHPCLNAQRVDNPQLPETVTTLRTPEGSVVYVVGTAHFSESSQQDVTQTIRQTQPDVVMVELCSGRVSILQLDEEKLLEEAKNINFEKIRLVIKQSGVIQGAMHLLLLSMSAHLTQQLGMAPGGEFRRAFREAQHIPGCKVHLGDRPISTTLRRALAALSWWQKIRLGWYMLTSKEPISKEDVEKCKQKDLLEEMLREMTGEFPTLSQVFVTERDMYLAHSLRVAAKPVEHPEPGFGEVPVVVVGVVGIGHVPGIVANWEEPCDIHELMQVPKAGMAGSVVRWSFRAALVGLISWGCYKVYRVTSTLIL